MIKDTISSPKTQKWPIFTGKLDKNIGWERISSQWRIATIDNLHCCLQQTHCTWFEFSIRHHPTSTTCTLYMHLLLEAYMSSCIQFTSLQAAGNLRKFFSLLCPTSMDMNIPLSPDTVTMDFEISAWHSARDLYVGPFVGVHIRWRFFHYLQCICRVVWWLTSKTMSR